MYGIIIYFKLACRCVCQRWRGAVDQCSALWDNLMARDFSNIRNIGTANDNSMYSYQKAYRTDANLRRAVLQPFLHLLLAVYVSLALLLFIIISYFNIFSLLSASLIEEVINI